MVGIEKCAFRKGKSIMRIDEKKTVRRCDRRKACTMPGEACSIRIVCIEISRPHGCNHQGEGHAPAIKYPGKVADGPPSVETASTARPNLSETALRIGEKISQAPQLEAKK